MRMSDARVVVIANVAEAFSDFLRRDLDLITQDKRVRHEQFAADRALLWAGDPKLVITSFPVPSLQYLRQHGGYPETEAAWPFQPSDCLCVDILREGALFNQIVDYAGPQRELVVIFYANTTQSVELVRQLERKGHVRVTTPEKPFDNSNWLVQHLDTKAGFRSLIANWISDQEVELPEGFISQTIAEAAQIARWFGVQGRTCIVKANSGENGYGNIIIPPNQFTTSKQIESYIGLNQLLGTEPIICEEYIESGTRVISPSYEGFIPHPEVGTSQMTYISLQLFREIGDFDGVLIGRGNEQNAWYSLLQHTGLSIGHRLQQLGYAGYFDLDAIVGTNGRLYLLEMNARRTGGTHVHDFASHHFGPDYAKTTTLLSGDSMNAGGIDRIEVLLERLDDLLFRARSKKWGVVPTVTSSLAEKRFGYLILGRSTEEVLRVQAEMRSRLTDSTASVSENEGRPAGEEPY